MRLAATALLCLIPSIANAQFVIDYETDEFCSNQGSFNLVSGSYFTGSSPDCDLMVADADEYSAAAWYSTPFDPGQWDRVETRFVLDIENGSLGAGGWDGMTFTLQSDDPFALGGYLELSFGGISPSVGIEFDTWDSGYNDPDNNHVGINENGGVTSLATGTPPMDLNDGTRAYVWVDFDVAAQTVDVYVSASNSKPGVATTSTTGVDLTAMGSTVYAGFTAAAGTYWNWPTYAYETGNDHVVDSWYLEAFDVVVDSDGDGVPDPFDVCPGFDDNIDPDNDSVPSGCDNCPNVFNNMQDDSDGDGVGNNCDPCPVDNPDDTDGDGVCDDADVCPGFDDAIDPDGDGVPTGCDLCPADNPNDSDADGVCNSVDACPGFNDALDGDGDGIPDGCDACPTDNPNDTDGDGVCESADICPGFDDSVDPDGDGFPNGCDPCPLDTFDDSDGDGACDSDDVCPGFDDSVDPDGDGVPTGCDACPMDNPNDTDGDGVCDSVDVCPGVDDYADTDGDGVSDCLDPCPLDNPDDSDGDSVCDSDDVCPGGDDTIDTDGDGAPNCADVCPNDALDDSDGDGTCDSVDVCPGQDDLLDTDSDGTPDCLDACPTDPTGDSDGDGVCNYADVCAGFDDNEDYDGDGIPNGCDTCVGVPIDVDGDGVPDPCDVCQGYNDYDDMDADGVPDACDACPTVAYEGDDDGDGFVTCDDCDDTDGTVFPGASGEVVADGIDQDCSGTELCYEDLDGDSFGSAVIVELTGLDCTQIPGGSDNDLDCDDGNVDAFPGADEIDFSGVDEDCDGLVDEDDPTTPGTGTGTGTGTGGDSTRDWAPDDELPEEIKAGPAGCGCDSSPGTTPFAAVGLLIALVRRRR